MNNSRLLKVMLSVAVVLGGAGFIVYSSLGHAEYYKMVDEVMVEPSEWVDKSLRVHGFVECGGAHHTAWNHYRHSDYERR